MLYVTISISSNNYNNVQVFHKVGLLKGSFDKFKIHTPSYTNNHTKNRTVQQKQGGGTATGDTFTCWSSLQQILQEITKGHQSKYYTN